VEQYLRKKPEKLGFRVVLDQAVDKKNNDSTKPLSLQTNERIK